MNRTVVLLAVCVCASPNLASAQGAGTSRTFISVNGAYQVTANDFADTATFTANAEEGTFSGDYRVAGGPALDIAAGFVVWRRLSIGVGVTRFTRSTPVTVSGAIPHPFFFNQPRAIAGTVAGLKREELLVNLQARFSAPLTNRIHMAVFGGPSLVQARQGVATAVTWTDAYPYDEAAFGSAATTTAKGDKIGFNVGGDVSFFFTRQIGVGAVAQYAGATVELPSATTSQEVKVGGARFGGGLRLRF